MKRNLIVTLSLVALAILAVSTSFAQSNVRANVPFSFQVGKAQLPAGTYTISKIADHSIAIEGSKGVLSTYLSNSRNSATPKLVFHKYGSSYFLAEICTGDGSMQVPQSKRERELQASNWGAPADELVVVAMK